MNEEIDNEKLMKLTMPFVEEDRTLSWWKFLSSLFLMITAFSLAVFPSWIALQLVCGVFAGLFMGRVFVIYHDYQHQSILKDAPLADALMSWFGLFALAPAGIWSMVHDHHHQHNSKFTGVVMGSFPILSVDDYLSLSKANKIKYRIIRHPLTILLSYISVFLISFCIYPLAENWRKHLDGLWSVLLHFSIATFIFHFFGGFSLVVGFLLPFTIMGLLGGYIFYAQHNFPEVQLLEDTEWSYFKAALYSSSFIKMNRFWRWVTANVGFHHIHHINPRIPFYRLPEAMNAIPYFQKPLTTSLSVKDISQCLALHLWNTESKRMVGFREVAKSEDFL